MALPLCIDKARGTSGQEKAIYLCWVMHLIGDIHQPLHSVSLFCEAFPKGDHGGNDSLYRLGGRRIIKLHQFWDDLLGKSVTRSSVKKGARRGSGSRWRESSRSDSRGAGESVDRILGQGELRAGRRVCVH